ncbi:MAG TPA: hypothetical protein GX509_09295 [Firmicutes bacterium]|nr:hypothetical protein [Bacillota bacterium]
MVYPSHFARGSYGLKDPDQRPFETVKKSLTDGLGRIAGARAKMRPWVYISASNSAVISNSNLITSAVIPIPTVISLTHPIIYGVISIGTYEQLPD